MKNTIIILISFLALTLSLGCSNKSDNPVQPIVENQSIVNLYGQLSVNGKNIVDQNGDIVVLRGMSLFWSQWGGAYYNAETVKWIRDAWKCTIVRASMGIEGNGFLDNPEQEYAKVKTVIEACIDLGIYVLIDWHDHHAENHIEEAKAFFNRVSMDYGSYPNVIYEIYNEPLAVSWKDVLKPYSEEIINTIRSNDQDNIIVVGTPNWSQDVEDVINEQINSTNIAYSLHYYSSTHKQELRDKALLAINAGIPIFVSEWGMSEASGNGIIDMESLNIWAKFLEDNNLSWCNWSLMNKDETSAALLPTTQTLSNWSEAELTQSGKIIRDYLIRMNSPIFELLK